MPKQTNTPDELADGKTVRRVFSGDTIVRSIDQDKREIEFIISNEAVDRYRDIIRADGWDLKNYRKNPVVLFGHNSSIPPIGKASKTRKDGTALLSVAQFMPREISAFADSIFQMYVGKYLRAVSVGFKPKDYEWITDADGKETGGIEFKKQELLEYSAVPIPANPEALVAARSAGIDTMPFRSWAEEILDNWQTVHDDVEKLYGVSQHDIDMIRRRSTSATSKGFQLPPDVQDQLLTKNLEAIRKQKAEKAKEKAELHEITIGEATFELPHSSEKDFEEVGTITIEQEEINGHKTFLIEGTPDVAKFDKSIFEMDDLGSFLEVEIEEADDKKQVIVTMSGNNVKVRYELVGYNEDLEILFGMKLLEEDVHLSNEDLENLDKDDDDDEDTTATDDEGGDDEDDDANANDDEGDDEEDDEEDDPNEDDDEGGDKSAKDNKNKSNNEDDDEDVVLTFNESVMFIERALVQFEEALDEQGNEKQSRHTERKLAFVAGCMRELADRLDGGSKEPGQQKADNVNDQNQAGDEVKTFESEEDVSKYIEDTTKAMMPVLSEIIAEKVKKLKGRLD